MQKNRTHKKFLPPSLVSALVDKSTGRSSVVHRRSEKAVNSLVRAIFGDEAAHVSEWKPALSRAIQTEGLYQRWRAYIKNDKNTPIDATPWEETETGKQFIEKLRRQLRANPRPSPGRKMSKRKKRPFFGRHTVTDRSRIDKQIDLTRRRQREVKEETKWSAL